MKRTITVLAVALVAAAGAAFAGQPSIEGNYVESRSCDVFTAACHANAEVGLKGHEATMGWQVTRGTYDGVDLAGLSVVAVVRANGTLMDTSIEKYDGRGVIIVDQRATAAQRDALVAFARSQAGSLLADVVKVQSAPITIKAGENQPHGCAVLEAGNFVTIETRCMHDGDKHCGNDAPYYPPLTHVDAATVAFTARDKFSGVGLGVTWDDSGRRSAFIAHFAK